MKEVFGVGRVDRVRVRRKSESAGPFDKWQTGPAHWRTCRNQSRSSSKTATTLTARMSSSLLSSLPSYDNLSNSRIQSLYSDISRQKHSNPTTYNSNIAWWHSTLEAIVSHGWLPNTPDRLILHAEQSLLESLRYERVGKPLCLGTVIVSIFHARRGDGG